MDHPQNSRSGLGIMRLLALAILLVLAAATLPTAAQFAQADCVSINGAPPVISGSNGGSCASSSDGGSAVSVAQGGAGSATASGGNALSVAQGGAGSATASGGNAVSVAQGGAAGSSGNAISSVQGESDGAESAAGAGASRGNAPSIQTVDCATVTPAAGQIVLVDAAGDCLLLSGG